MPPPQPPYATDEPPTVYYDSNSANHRRIRQPRPPNPNDRTSAYNLYDDYLGNSNDKPLANNVSKPEAEAKMVPVPVVYQQPIPTKPLSIAQPRPGYAAPIAALNLSQPSPAPAHQQGQPSPRYDHTPQSSPHPLQPPSTPIVPIFAAPKSDGGVRFANPSPVMRGHSEETLIPKQNNDFWRRFSMVVKEESAKPREQRESSWLKETRSGTSCFSRWVWFVGIILLLIIGGSVGISWYFTHNNNQQNQRPDSIGGSQNESASPSLSTSSHIVSSTSSTGASFHVTPTNTVARREPIPTAFIGHGHNRISH